MANPEHLQILQQGVETWNQWREQNKNIRPDLRSADLASANLEKANLASANLEKANLASAILVDAILVDANLGGVDLGEASLNWTDLGMADLGGADLRGADVREADLGGADLRGAYLTMAHLGGADLGGADLGGADLGGTNLTSANLTRADLSDVGFDETVFGNTNLTAAKGLETCRHIGPSVLDHRTLAQSGPLPLTFLRGCGLPEALIEYLPSLLGEPFQFYSCFISYASKDHAFAERLHGDLQNKGVRCWFAPEHMKMGDRLRLRIDETIRVYDKLLLVLFKASLASQWVEQEVATALARERQQGTTILFPVRIDNTVMTREEDWPAFIRNTRHIGDFRRWKTHGVYQQAFDRLLRDLKAAERNAGA